MVLTFTPEVIFFSRFATEQNVNWALAHGYSASLYSAALLPPQHHILWSQPYATLLEAERPECSFLLHLEADVVINAVQRSFAPVLERFMQAPGTELLLSCHSPFATPDGSCHQPACSCTRRSATSSNQKPSIPSCMPQTTDHHQGAAWCAINAGVHVVRNTPTGRSILRFWTEGGDGSGDRGHKTGARTCNRDMSTHVRREFGLQKCAKTLYERFRAHVDVLSGIHFNTPSGYNSSLLQAVDPIGAYIEARKSGKWYAACLQDDSTEAPFACHTLGISAVLRATAFNTSLAMKSITLAALLQARGEEYVNLGPRLCELGPCNVKAEEACATAHIKRCR